MHENYERNLDLNLLRVFAVVAEEGSVTRAATRLYVTQPAVSAAMRRLASFVGAQLFAREGRGIVLTPRGTSLLAAAHAHLQPLVAATMAIPVFDPVTSAATVRLGLADGLEALVMPGLLALLRSEAPAMKLIVLPVQFRTVEELLLSARVDLAVTVADELPQSISRQALTSTAHARSEAFVCVHDPRHSGIRGVLTEREYFERPHAVVSYAGDLRGIVEDALGKTRRVQVSLPAMAWLGPALVGSPLLATVPRLIALKLVESHPQLALTSMPFALENAVLEVLWRRVSSDDPVLGFVRGLVTRVVAAVDPKPLRRRR